jgi:CRISPR-associated exonuclease Cas4
VKSSSRSTPADQAQVIHYCFRLRQAGIETRGGILHYPKTRRTLRVEYGQAQEAQARADITAAIEVITAGQSPSRLNRSACRGCSYLAYGGSIG